MLHAFKSVYCLNSHAYNPINLVAIEVIPKLTVETMKIDFVQFCCIMKLEFFCFRKATET